MGQETGGIGDGDLIVDTARGDDVISETGLEHPDVVKIDVEGAEGPVVSGMSDALANARRVYCEVHLSEDHHTSIESYDWTLPELLNRLESLGLEIESLKSRGREVQIVGDRRE